MEKYMLLAQLSAEKTLNETDIPSATLQLLTGKQEGVARPGGIFTKEDLINIKLYVKKGLSLPFNLEEVKSYLDYQKIDIAGLEPEDIHTLFEEIRTHSFSWSDVENDILQQSIDLEIIGKQITETGENIISIINEMPIITRIKRRLGEISEKQLARITYTHEDREVSSALGEILDTMKNDIEKQREKTEKVKTEVSDFKLKLIGGRLSNGSIALGLQPQVENKRKLMKDNKMSVSIGDLDDKIMEKKEEIVQLKKDYDKFVGLAFSGIVGGLIGLAITGGIFGSKAEEVRKRKNMLIEEVRSLEESIKGKRALQKSITSLSLDFSDIDTRLLDAEVALNHLDYMWQSMLTQINASKDKFTQINDALNLTSFITKFQQVINPWKEVEGSAKQLVRVFDEALKEYKHRYN
ncbi:MULTISPECIES: alpha-xenorhabdolysin family binary toxin subunit A [Photorhabdus]|uniref:Photorhabdus luminescens subsp. laumondii TTO1 complete genome segment 11/17 n=1 Tax=Photorhabdus laumondii subsp. laumondii (strain DSM 15139 / CIP 105565 / TT01) TaxID=243265 RepID=Q7N2K1_PHOLL|nr:MULTISPECIES: alpha-xenorhabdolysin family binary toxin subunit A [Photorhabdus]AWK42776.1 XaxA [Photorhabdus laumondii subsp. laumondii]AXG43551.1 XaxA [Photorhabdus laumondii subsp. laumondii]AXG48094.1 XaxA [Photorhabdus laumondii subsp. laumondii]KTL62614.1 XaxA [Photorhabdus laumondii subsp. laumondii]MCC8389412.1 alpha-xenorhabdolysin family binary toxin subunit A [Photorhabdus laumondii]